MSLSLKINLITTDIFVSSRCSDSLKSSLFTADIRSLDVFISEVPEIPAIGIDTMKKLAKKLKFNYKADTFENPFQRVSARISVFDVVAN